MHCSFEKKILGYFVLLFILPCLIINVSCRKEKVYANANSAQIQFSCDSILFDTLFSQMGSVTKIIQLKNTGKDWVKVEKMYFQQGAASIFRSNINGDTSRIVSNIKLPPHDSIFIFIKTAIKEQNSNLPLLVEDQLIAEYSGKTAQVYLSAWGQDAYFHLPTDILKIPFPDPNNPEKIDTQKLAISYLDASQILPNDKPHIISGYAVVKEGDNLIIPAGCQIHFDANSGLIISPNASLTVNGSKGQEVVFQGIRLESDYADGPAQWDKIWFQAGSHNNSINYAIIKNGNTGIQIDSSDVNANNFALNNTIIKNFSDIGLLACHTKILATNLVISNCQNGALNLAQGGEYSFYHCTFTNYFSTGQFSLLMSDYKLDALGNKQENPFVNTEFTNCIFYGAMNAQLNFDFSSPDANAIYFTNCLLRQNKAVSNANDCKYNQDPLFVDESNQNFEIQDPNSPAYNAGSASGLSLAPQDINQNTRASIPTIGAYEYRPK